MYKQVNTNLIIRGIGILLILLLGYNAKIVYSKQLNVNNQITSSTPYLPFIKPSYNLGQTNATTPNSNASIMFIENIGQFNNQARFKVQGETGTVWLSTEGIYITLLEPSNTNKFNKVGLKHYQPTSAYKQGVNIKLNFTDANPTPRLESFNRLPTSFSSFIGNNTAEWYKNIPIWGGVRYVDLYPGIDLEITGENGHLVPQLIIKDNTLKLNYQTLLQSIALQVEGSTDLNIDNNYLIIKTVVGDFRVPLLQLVMNNKTISPSNIPTPKITNYTVTTPFSKKPSSSSGIFEAINNPIGLIYSSFLGGDSHDFGHNIAVDDAQQIYIVGHTLSTNFFTETGVITLPVNDFEDGLVMKFNSTTNSLTYITLLGGDSFDINRDIKIDEEGNAYITGFTGSENFPTTSGAFDTDFNGIVDSFVVKLDNTGSNIIYATLLGGSDIDYSDALEIDEGGNVYIASDTFSSDFPITTSAFDTDFNGNSDIYVTKLNATGDNLVYSTFLGGSENDFGDNIALDHSNNIYITGWTTSNNFPITANALDNIPTGHSPYVVKLNSEGSDLVYATFLGVEGYPLPKNYDIAIDNTGSAYVVGDTYIITGTNNTRNINLIKQDSGLFINKLTPQGNSLDYSMILSTNGSHLEDGYAVAIDQFKNVYVAGDTYSVDFPTSSNAFDTTHNGELDTFIFKLSAISNTITYATLVGGSANDISSGITVDKMGRVYMVGYTDSPDFPITPNSFDSTYNNGGRDAFVIKLQPGFNSTYIYTLNQNGLPITNTKLYRSGKPMLDINGQVARADNKGLITTTTFFTEEQLVVMQPLYEYPTIRQAHNPDGGDNFAYRVYINNMPISNTGIVLPYTIPNYNQVYTLTTNPQNPLVLFNLVASIEWDASADYLDSLELAFKQASDYLYDISDGQMAIGWVSIYDNREYWLEADLQLLASNDVQPRAEIGGLIANDSTKKIHLGRLWDGDSGNNGEWHLPYGYRTVIHEFGHYGLHLEDEYFITIINQNGYPIGIAPATCTDETVKTNNNYTINGSIMYYQYNASELVDTLNWNNNCQNTEQHRVNGEADWQTVLNYYDGLDWVLKTPSLRGGIMDGPDVFPKQVLPFPYINLNNSGIITGSLYNLTIFYPSGEPAIDAVAWLYTAVSSHTVVIEQGRTNQQGQLTLYGATANDIVQIRTLDSAYYKDLLLTEETNYNVTLDPVGRMKSKQLQNTENIYLQITPYSNGESFDLTISGFSQKDEILTATVKPLDTSLTTAHSPLSYSSIEKEHRGVANLDGVGLEGGQIIVKSSLPQSNFSSVYNLQKINVLTDNILYSVDGNFELHLPSNSIPIGNWVYATTLSTGYMPAELPNGKEIIGEAYQVNVSGGTAILAKDGLLKLYYHPDITGYYTNTAIYRWSTTYKTWQKINNTTILDNTTVGTINKLGIYALFGVKFELETIYLPFIFKY